VEPLPLDPRLAGLARAVATAGAVTALDQAAKQAIVGWLERGEQVNVFLGVDLTYTRNRGVAFGALEGGDVLIGILIGIALSFLIAYFALHADMPWLWLPVGLLLGGAFGNLADRARDGSVIDYIDPVAWPAFNLADAVIVAGVLALLYVVEGGRGADRAARR
jgi:signal peptidase II